jgi:hypothetical protein
MYNHGLSIGLTGDALDNFRFTCNEVELTVDVNEQTGTSVIVAVDGRNVAASENSGAVDNSSESKTIDKNYIKSTSICDYCNGTAGGCSMHNCKGISFNGKELYY